MIVFCWFGTRTTARANNPIGPRSLQCCPGLIHHMFFVLMTAKMAAGFLLVLNSKMHKIAHASQTRRGGPRRHKASKGGTASPKIRRAVSGRTTGAERAGPLRLSREACCPEPKSVQSDQLWIWGEDFFRVLVVSASSATNKLWPKNFSPKQMAPWRLPDELPAPPVRARYVGLHGSGSHGRWPRGL